MTILLYCTIGATILSFLFSLWNLRTDQRLRVALTRATSENMVYRSTLGQTRAYLEGIRRNSIDKEDAQIAAMAESADSVLEDAFKMARGDKRP